jgi:hypothetical protein
VAKKNTKKAPAEKASRATNDEMFERVQIIRDLASGNGYPTRRELAGKFGISERALANIIAAMKSRMGIDIRSELGPEGKHGYKVHDANFLRTKMSRPEAIASVLLTEAVLGTPLIGDRKAAQSSNAKLEGAIDPDVRRQLDRLKQRFAVRLLQEAKKPGEGFFSRVLDGIAENRVLQVSYEKPAEAAKRRREDAGTPTAAARAQRIESLEIEPWGIFFAKRSWYLVARTREVRRRHVGVDEGRCGPSPHRAHRDRRTDGRGRQRDAVAPLAGDRTPTRRVDGADRDHQRPGRGPQLGARHGRRRARAGAEGAARPGGRRDPQDGGAPGRLTAAQKRA